MYRLTKDGKGITLANTINPRLPIMYGIPKRTLKDGRWWNKGKGAAKC